MSWCTVLPKGSKKETQDVTMRTLCTILRVVKHTAPKIHHQCTHYQHGERAHTQYAAAAMEHFHTLNVGRSIAHVFNVILTHLLAIPLCFSLSRALFRSVHWFGGYAFSFEKRRRRRELERYTFIFQHYI